MLSVIFVLTLLAFASCLAEDCSHSSPKIYQDAQSIRLKAMDVRRKVGETAFLTATSIVKAQNEFYPQNQVEICLREEAGTLQIKAQAKPQDAGQGKSHRIAATKIRAGSVKLGL